MWRCYLHLRWFMVRKNICKYWGKVYHLFHKEYKQKDQLKNSITAPCQVNSFSCEDITYVSFEMCRVWFLISWCLRSNFLIPNLRSVKSRLVAHQNKERVSHWNSKMANWCLRSFQFLFVWSYHYLLLDFFVLMQVVRVECHTMPKLVNLWRVEFFAI